MKTSLISLMKAAVLILLLSVCSLNSSPVKAQCGFSYGILDSTHTLNFSAAPGGMDTEKVVVTNTSGIQITINLFMPSNASGQFRFLDSVQSLNVGASKVIPIRFQPSIASNGTITGFLYFKNQSGAGCRDTIKLIGIVKPNLCLETTHALSYKDPVLIGSTANHEFLLTNQSGADVQITSISLDNNSAGFAITTPLPLIVPAHSSTTVLDYSFAPTSNYGGNYFSTAYATINLLGDTGCTSISVLLIGNVAKPGGGSGIDTNIRPLFPSEIRTLAITGNGKPDTMQFTFSNNLNGLCSVNNVFMKDGTFFKVISTNPAPIPFILQTDAEMTVSVVFNATDQQIHTDSLMINASHNLTATAFPLQGVQLAPANVAEFPSDVAISVLPNPVSKFLTVNVAGIRTADIQVFDMLGKQVASIKSNSSWKWDVTDSPDGAYIVRISGESMIGEHFVASKRVIVTK